MCGMTKTFVMLGFLTWPFYTTSDNLVVLTKTLKTMQRAACDDETVSLACPSGTSITIQVAQYGKVTPEGHMCLVDRGRREGHERCLWPNSMQYSLLQRVVEACQKKPHCSFSTHPKDGAVDPCPKTRKFVEVAYKCRPSEFHIKAACEEDTVALSCRPHSRVLIFEAKFGRRAYEPLSCPQPQEFQNTTCLRDATLTVMQQCHGKRRCEVAASSRLFGNPCHAATKNSLKIVYACVPLGVLLESYETAAERDEAINADDVGRNQSYFDEKGDAVVGWGEQQPPPEPEPTSREVYSYDPGEPDSSESNYIIYMYFGLALLVTVILIIIIIGIRYFIMRKNTLAPKSDDMYTTEVPNVFNDAVSDIDNDIDVQHISGTFYEHPDMILYKDVPGNKGVVRAMRPLSTIYPCTSSNMYGNVDYVSTIDRKEVVMSPKTLSRYSDSNFFYA